MLVGTNDHKLPGQSRAGNTRSLDAHLPDARGKFAFVENFIHSRLSVFLSIISHDSRNAQLTHWTLGVVGYQYYMFDGATVIELCGIDRNAHVDTL